jgi:hypothetical protein
MVDNSCHGHLEPVGWFSVTVTKYLREVSLKEEKFILAHGFNP